jgi:hypothetical protein
MQYIKVWAKEIVTWIFGCKSGNYMYISESKKSYIQRHDNTILQDIIRHLSDRNLNFTRKSFEVTINMMNVT